MTENVILDLSVLILKVRLHKSESLPREWNSSREFSLHAHERHSSSWRWYLGHCGVRSTIRGKSRTNASIQSKESHLLYSVSIIMSLQQSKPWGLIILLWHLPRRAVMWSVQYWGENLRMIRGKELALRWEVTKSFLNSMQLHKHLYLYSPMTEHLFYFTSVF